MMARSALCAAALLWCSVATAQPWTHFGRSPSRVAATSGGPDSLAAAAWVAATDPAGGAITFNPQAGVVADARRVYATGTSGGTARVYAFARAGGAAEWSAPIPAAVFGSWSTPAVDPGSGIVVVASGSWLLAFERTSGALQWQTVLNRPVVHASPLVTSDRGPADRAFITDYDGFGTSGRLYCVNVDPFDGALNPHQPGAIVWWAPLGGTSGNTPAYAGGVVYVAGVSDVSGSTPGVIRAVDAGTGSVLWTFVNPVNAGFFGGVSVESQSGGTFVYAASYAFGGGQFSANLVKVDGAGGLAWSVPSNRTSATPIPLGDGRIVLSTGIAGFGSAPSVQMFTETAGGAALTWDSAVETWSDLNSNGSMDPGEYLLVGGWTHQPAVSGTRMLAGAIPVSGVGPCTGLYALDLGRSPADPGFVIEQFAGAGSTGAATGRNMYTVGAAGLYAFGPAPCFADCNGDGALNLADFGCFQTRFAVGDPEVDCNGDGVLNLADFGCFQTSFALGCP